MNLSRQWNRLLMWLRQGQMPRWIVLGVIVGMASGLAAAAFFYALEATNFVTFDLLCGHPFPVPAGERIFSWEGGGVERRWLLFLLPAVGGLLSGLLVYFLAPEAAGEGTNAMIGTFHNKDGDIPGRVPVVKAFAAILTIATGGSSGREGPISQIGAGIGSVIAKAFKLPIRDRRILMLAGAGSGLGAIFRAPLGGALASLEVIYKEDLETDALIPTVIAAITSYTLFRYILLTVSGVEGLIFQIPAVSFKDPRQIIFYIGLGLVCVPIGMFYTRTFYFLRDRVFEPLKVPTYVKPMIGGLLVGMIGLWIPQVYAGGWGHIQVALFGRVDLLPIKIMALIVIFKILATNFTIGSGGSGGMFGPTLFIGGMIGGVVGSLAQHFFPHIVPDGRAFILVGMASFFAGVAHAPLAALLMVTEMSGSYELVAPLLLVSVIAIMFNRHRSLYQAQVENKFMSPAHAGDLTVNVLEDMTVKSVYKSKPQMHRIDACASIAQVQYHLAREDDEVLPVVREDGTIIGIISLDTSRPVLFDEDVTQFLIAQDLASPVPSLTPEDSLYKALLAFLKHPVPGLLVVDPQDPNQILGILNHTDLIRAYNNEIVKLKES